MILPTLRSLNLAAWCRLIRDGLCAAALVAGVMVLLTNLTFAMRSL